MSFEEWFYEIENYALRAERFWEDLESFQEGKVDSSRIEMWLRAAYEMGKDDDSRS